MKPTCFVSPRFTLEMSLTAYHARYFAHELNKRSCSALVGASRPRLPITRVYLRFRALGAYEDFSTPTNELFNTSELICVTATENGKL